MRVRLQRLRLTCRQSIEDVDLSANVSFFHGKISAGKSSIPRLVDYCFGGEVERTPALKRELLSVSLAVQFGVTEALLERGASSNNQVQITWKQEDGSYARVLAPIQASSEGQPIWGDNVYNLSDLLFFFLGVTPIKVRRSKRDADSPLVRLSFRDLMFYCYLDQDEIDSSFFHMEHPFKLLKSRDVMRFVVGYYTERLNDLEGEIEKCTEDRAGKIEAAAQLEASLKELGFESADQIDLAMTKLRVGLEDAESERTKLLSGDIKDEHLADDLRKALRQMSYDLSLDETAVSDQTRAVSELEALRSELIVAKLKFGRAEAASAVLAKAEFERCPLCGVPLEEMVPRPDQACELCATPLERQREIFSAEAEAVQKDLDSRLDDIDVALNRQTEARREQLSRLETLRAEKAELDRQLTRTSETYDSNYLARMRDVEIRIARLQEQVKAMTRLLRLPEMAKSLKSSAEHLLADIAGLRREVDHEKGRLGGALQYVNEIEDEFLKALTAVQIPGIGPADEVELDIKTWIPHVLPGKDESLRWGFENAGSGGKKTLFKACYAIAVHVVAERRGLPLPSFLIIDTPMKNIGEEVNRDLFRSFYTYLYGLASGPLAKTQIIIIDKEFYPMANADVVLFERYMTPDDPNHPPLVSYYRGP